VREVIHAALGSDLPMQLSCDPKLIAGFEIRGRNVIVRNNWQADLATIKKELDR
jgi:F0F1-type ATP synthase delta subunit